MTNISVDYEELIRKYQGLGLITIPVLVCNRGCKKQLCLSKLALNAFVCTLIGYRSQHRIITVIHTGLLLKVNTAELLNGPRMGKYEASGVLSYLHVSFH